MVKSKKFILVALLIVVIAASTAVVAFAQTGTSDESQTPESQEAALLVKVATIYQGKTGVALDTTALKESLAEARIQIRDEALVTRLQKLVADGKITQEQADQYSTWWQDKPDTPLFGQIGGHFGDMMRGRMGGPGDLPVV
ncbi:MAG: hypothetical protein PHV74_10370 [Dehalococcoidia bacterium]|nr:hypothetical protein [Dehalococcoidia bacterium]